MRLVRVTTADESVEFEAEKVTLTKRAEGLSILPSHKHENVLGFRSLFYPWNEIRQIKEYDSE